MKQWMMKSKIGPLYLVASEMGLQGVFWKRREVPMAKNLTESGPEVGFLARAEKQLTQYLNGERRDFDVPLDIVGTDFQKRVWRELARIPYGQTRSYAQIARQIKNHRAVRAVGAANGRNPLCLILPCHRVIGSDGSLTGYAGKVNIKQHLLEMEGGAKSFGR